MGISVDPVPLPNGRLNISPILTDDIRKYLHPLEVQSDSPRILPLNPKQERNWGSLDLKTSTLVTSSIGKYELAVSQAVISDDGTVLGDSEGPKHRQEQHASEKSKDKLSQSSNGELRNGDDASDEEEEEEDSAEEIWTYPEDSISSYGVDPKDEGTSDKWIRRHPEMVRLTGRHPFNSEPPLSRLMEHGFITPTPLHYVRNHGYVPQATFDDWTVEVSGLVKRPQTFNMRQIMQEFEPRELPVTLVCAGNRRKEQNMVQQTIGFNWGAAGVSTSVWRGARLCDVLRRCGVASRRKGALYVCFEGQETLPGGGGSKYGTSISLAVAMDEAQEVLVAYMQNGKLLEPDHGFPVRMIIPGYIGGRMVKWVCRISVTNKESDNYYHYHDNRVLPSHIDAEKANAENWWYKPDYIINELNVNSVITTPAHAEVVAMNAAALQKPYKMRGYAYSGGGRKVIRVEVTIDGGESWRLCTVNHPEKPTKHGKYWCWCFWELEVELMELLQAKELAVRAWDAAMNTQPQHLTWNVMGMMNNCWFRAKISPCKPKEGGIGLIFEHPTRPGNQSGGWMVPKEVNKTPLPEKPTLQKSVSSPFLNRAVRQITMAELKNHNTADSPWIVVRNNVYDCTRFLKDHPGGSDSILINAGTDCTEEFDAIHSAKAQAMLADFKIGELASFGSLSADSTPDSSLHGGNQAGASLQSLFSISESSPARFVALNPRRKITCTLTEKKILSHDVRLFRFALPNKEQVLGLPVGKHMFLSATINGKLCMRAYTPVSSDDEVGYFDLLIKVYFKGVNPSFPAGGLMSQHLEALAVGSTIEVKGPVGHIEYRGKGHFTVAGKAMYTRRCAMLAGGTGITPMYQVIRSILKDPEDKTEVYLVFANRTEADIMLREELDGWAREHSNFHVWYVLSTPPSPGRAWGFSTGYIREEILREHLPPAAGCSSCASSAATGAFAVVAVDDRKGGGGAAVSSALVDEEGDHQEEGDDEGDKTVAFICGPPPMIELACLPSLEKLGYDRSLCFLF